MAIETDNEYIHTYIYEHKHISSIKIIYHHHSSRCYLILKVKGLLYSVIVPVRYSHVPPHMLYGEAFDRSTIRNSTQRNR